MGSNAPKCSVCLIGSGGVGTIGSVVLENSGRAHVTAVLRSKYKIVSERGWDIESVDHGTLKGWKPSRIVATVAEAALPPSGTEAQHYDYVFVSTKQLPDSYSVAELIRPVVTPGVTAIVLIQNGLDIELPIIEAFPKNTVISGVSVIGSRTVGENGIAHIGSERVIMGPHFHDGLDRETQIRQATEFVAMYDSGGPGIVSLDLDMPKARWYKLLWNGTFNTLCALMKMDVGEVQSSKGRESLLVPMMRELVAIAKEDGVELPEAAIQKLAYGLPDDCPYRPSMLVDVEQGRLMEIEVILGNALKKAEKYGVSAPKCSTVYELLKMEQWRIQQNLSGVLKPKPSKVDGTSLF
ncbi:2-dehydropantoate 2-reductase [Pseudogymnoascus sp. 03VT05]|nr:2-dehydropantoate 2-reductase [Pseudogymnoascus sp. 03VT05]